LSPMTVIAVELAFNPDMPANKDPIISFHPLSSHY
jgi:hypothetical protein